MWVGRGQVRWGAVRAVFSLIDVGPKVPPKALRAGIFRANLQGILFSRLGQ